MVNTIIGDIMRHILNFSKVVTTIFILLFVGIFIISFTIENTYENQKICREESKIVLEKYKNIDGVIEVKLIENCDHVKLYFLVENTFNNENINSIILKINLINQRENDDELLEIILSNESLNYIVIIDKNEGIDIDFTF